MCYCCVTFCQCLQTTDLGSVLATIKSDPTNPIKMEITNGKYLNAFYLRYNDDSVSIIFSLIIIIVIIIINRETGFLFQRLSVSTGLGDV